MKNLIVLFPGKSYTVNHPLLYYAGFKYVANGYECKKVSYEERLDIAETVSVVLEQLKDINFSEYKDVLFISKSLGTVVAGHVSEVLNINVRHVYLTPIISTLPFICGGKNISVVAAGTADSFIDADILKEHCEREGIRLELFEGADHGLEVSDDVDNNIDVLKRVIELC